LGTDEAGQDIRAASIPSQRCVKHLIPRVPVRFPAISRDVVVNHGSSVYDKSTSLSASDDGRESGYGARGEVITNAVGN
jgi:hypothetical protein